MRITPCIAIALLLASFFSYGQSDSVLNKAIHFPDKIFTGINRKASGIDDALTKQTTKYLRKLEGQEKKIQQRLYKIDSNAAKNVFNGTANQYSALQNKIAAPSSTSNPLTGEYMPYVDSMKTTLAFVQANPAMLNNNPKVQAEFAASLAQFNQLQNNFSNANQVNAYLLQRKQALKDQLSGYMQNTAIKKYVDSYNQQVYYFSDQVRQYKEALNDPDKMLQKSLAVLNRVPAFTNFMKKNSQLSAFLGMPDNYGTSAGLDGLQTRDQVQGMIQEKTGAPGSPGMAAFQSNLESAHSQLDLLKDKLGQLGGGSADMPMPDFRPNNQKTHPFLKRLEIGMNLQTTTASYLFPTTTDIGLSLGYKLNNKFTTGIGGSYNIGWGQSINHIHVTNNGASIRTFIDMQVKQNFYLSGGYELNYQQVFTSFSQIQSVDDWSKSGLIGVTKMISLPGKLIKKTELQFFWDFLSYSQVPKTAQFLFRVGYKF